MYLFKMQKVYYNVNTKWKEFNYIWGFLGKDHGLNMGKDIVTVLTSKFWFIPSSPLKQKQKIKKKTIINT